jgi:hypothetical protein
MKTVYILQHVHEHLSGNEDVKFIGVYSSRAQALAAIKRLSSASGFRDRRKGFCIDAYRVDEDHWVEGFVDGTP